MESLLNYFSFLTDFRVERTREHSLEDNFFITIVSVMCSVEGWNELEELEAHIMAALKENKKRPWLL